MSDEPLSPTDEQLQAWAQHIEYLRFITRDVFEFEGDYPDEGTPFPPYYDDEHRQYLDGMFAELREARATIARVKALAYDPDDAALYADSAIVVDATVLQNALAGGA